MSDMEQTDGTKNWAASFGVIGAILASSCCILPFVFLMLGVSGAWIGNLTVLEPYKDYFAAVTLVFLGVGFWQVYIKPKRQCAEGYCATPRSDRIIKIILWVSAVLVLLALTVDIWAPILGNYI
ncbi:mercuric transporter MerT family protein [Gimibacter soli]|uniref:Mercuric transport protein MerT n=1 Tax=Gimibacter soli TaxID=3024400 RepID=A0AAE9XTA7_9PROT|nr:mercuric transporter MerT family protein [Gimibacter soli]WCL52893.1 mercuric transporter MerT family protein [Gimibacter soli]